MSSEKKYLNTQYENFFEKKLSEADPEIFDAVNKELIRQQNHIELIASENIVSQAVLEAQGSVLTNKYAEGYPGNLRHTYLLKQNLVPLKQLVKQCFLMRLIRYDFVV